MPCSCCWWLLWFHRQHLRNTSKVQPAQTVRNTEIVIKTNRVPLVETDRIVEELDLQAERRRVNQYTLLRVLGEGTSGTVHYAQHTADGKREFAVKEISKGRLKKRFMRKAHSRSASLHSLMLLPQSTSSPSSASMQSIGGVLRTSPASNNNNNNNSNINNNNDNNNNRQFLRINNGGGGGQITINPDGWQRELKRELKVLKRLQQCPTAGPHPNIVRLYEVMDDPDVDSLFMVFEYCPNGPVVKISCLSNTSKSTSSASPPMTEGRARYLFRQLSLAINFMHENGIAHCDLKPDNLLLDSKGDLRVVDFGTAVFLDRSRPISIASPPSSAAVNDIVDDEDDSAAVDITAAARGTPAFTPPESLQTQRRLPQPTGSAINSYSSGSSDRVNIPSSLATIDWVKVDIWAMGVTLYCMLYGVLPFTGENILELNDRIRTARPAYPANVIINSAGLDLLQRLLAKNPGERISIQQILSHPWLLNSMQPFQ